MVEFFPESFDRLTKDPGLFPGPLPVLLESCSFRQVITENIHLMLNKCPIEVLLCFILKILFYSDLAVLLRGNMRKTSHIEFGAHQAILVVNEAARDNVPDELHLGLILTIYEAKGLEFNDILLYNFFKDSQVGL